MSSIFLLQLTLVVVVIFAVIMNFALFHGVIDKVLLVVIFFSEKQCLLLNLLLFLRDLEDVELLMSHHGSVELVKNILLSQKLLGTLLDAGNLNQLFG